MRGRFKSRVQLRRLSFETNGGGRAHAGPEARPALRAKLDGRDFEFGPGLTVLEALRTAGGDVPTLCSDERLKPCGNCRLCLVGVKGAVHPLDGLQHAAR